MNKDQIKKDIGDNIEKITSALLSNKDILIKLNKDNNIIIKSLDIKTIKK